MTLAVRTRALLAGLVGIAAMTGIPAFAAADTSTPDDAVAADRTVNVWQWNVAGWKLHHGSTTDGLIPAATSSITNRDTDFVAVNELCRGQYDALIDGLTEAGWPTDPDNFARFESYNDTACDGEPFGIAILSRRALGAADRVALPADNGNERHQLLCAASEPIAARLCTTHITPSNDVIDGEKINETQLNYVNDRVEDYYRAGESVIIAGDFNAQPNYGRLNGWYSSRLDTGNNPDNTGHYRELDDDDAANCPGYGENTVAEADPPGPCGPGKKIDLIFVRDDRLSGDYDSDSLSISAQCGGPCSDHRIIIGTATVSG
ncbi:MAG: endonuclease/exonuclease/phosphatase family protein [Stackebrandtia sp.]